MTVIENLQQDIEHIRMRFFDLVKQDHRIRLPPHRLGQLPTLFIADVTGRGSKQSADRMSFHILGHVNANQVLFAVE